MNTKNGPTMFDTVASFGGITIRVDPINRPRTEGSDNVMAIFEEEQPFMWEFAKEDIAVAIFAAMGEIDFLDVGTGSGVWSILVAKNTDAKNIIAIDKSPRAIKEAAGNAKRNGVSFSLQQEFYNMNSAPYRSAKAIGIYAPYHLYPSEIEMKIPQHARGGIDGQQIFREQLTVANYHLAWGGIIVFNQMCLGRYGRPEFFDYVDRIVDESSVVYTNVLPPTKTADFLKRVYGNQFLNYQRWISTTFPELYYCDGIITRDGKRMHRRVDHKIDLKGRTWADRIELHRQIALHGLE